MTPQQRAAFAQMMRDTMVAAQKAANQAALGEARRGQRSITKMQIDEVNRRYNLGERKALEAGRRENEIVRRNASASLAVRRKSSQEIARLEVSRLRLWRDELKKSYARVLNDQERAQRAREESERGSGRRRASGQERSERSRQEWARRAWRWYEREEDRSYRRREQGEQRSYQRGRTQQQQSFRVAFAIFEDFLKRRRAREREEQYERLARQKATDRAAWEEQRTGNSRMLIGEREAAQSRLAVLRESQRRETNAHKAKWSMIRSITETGARFMSSITQSALRSMGNAVGRGFRAIVGRTRAGTNRQEAVLRDSMADQTRLVTRAMVQQQGAVAAFQNTVNRGAVGSLLSLRNVLLGFGGYMSARAIFGPLMEYEQTQVAFENLLGSASAAEDMLKDLRAFNVATPFELPQIEAAAKQLLAMGETAEEVIPDLTAIGDVGAKFSATDEDVNGVVRALGQMSQSARVSAQDINQIQQRFVGFNARAAIARGLGVSLAEAMEMIADGSISGNEGMNAMIEGMKSEENAAGAMAEQMQTLSGRISNFKDLLNQILLDALVPLLPYMAAVVEQVTLFISSLAQGKGVWAIARSALLGIATALGLILAQKGVVAVFELMGAALKVMAANPITVLVGSLIALGVTLYRSNDAFKAFVDDFLAKIGDWINEFRGPAEATFQMISEGIGGIATAIMDGDWSGAYQQLAVMVTNIRTLLEPATDFLVEFGQDAWQKWQDWLDSGGFGDLADTIKWRILDAVIKVKEGIDRIDWEGLLKPALVAAGLAIGALLLGVPGWLVVGAGAAVAAYFTSPRFREEADKALDAIAEWFDETLKPWLEEQWGKVTGWFGGIDWESLWATVLSGLEQLTAQITEWLTLFVTSKEFWKWVGIITAILASLVGAVIVGFIEGLFSALTQRNEEVNDAIVEWLAGVFDGVVIPFANEPLYTMLEDVNESIDWNQVWGGLWQAMTTGILTSVFNVNWYAVWGWAWAIATQPFYTTISQAATALLEEVRTEFQVFTQIGGIIVDAIVAGLQWNNDMYASIANGVIDVMNGVIRTFNGTLPDQLGSGLFSIPLPDNPIPEIPRLAKGGIVTQPTIAMIGEAGPEAVIPLDQAGVSSIPFTISFDPAAVAAQVEAVVAIVAEMGPKIIEASMPGMRRWVAAVTRILVRIETGFTAWGARMQDLAMQISTGIATGIATGLRAGRREVVSITRGYARSVVAALNPLLSGVGEEPITLEFARGGIAEAAQGAQVHIFNEGRRGRGSSHGEAYIPFDPTNKNRSRALTDETARRLGGQVQWFAEGGITANQIQAGEGIPGVSGDIVGLVREFARRLSAWSLASGGGYVVNSGYRSIAEQTRLYQDYLAGVPGQAQAAPPGSSLHNFGLASDGNRWRDRNPGAFGLVYPMSYEPWHVQPVEGRGLLSGDSAFPTFEPLPQPPDGGDRGWLSRVAEAVMGYVYDKVLAASSQFMAPMSAPSLGANASADVVTEMQRQAGLRGWGTGAQWAALSWIIDRESSWNPNAQNPTSTAYGLFQFLDSTWAGTGIPKTSNFVQQIIAGLRYIASRYGTPLGAQSFWQANGYYADGGMVDREGMYVLAEGNRPEAVIPLTNNRRALQVLRETGLDKLILGVHAAESASTPDLAGVLSGSGGRGAPTIGEVHYTQVINSRGNEGTVARLVKKDTDRNLRSALMGVN